MSSSEYVCSLTSNKHTVYHVVYVPLSKDALSLLTSARAGLILYIPSRLIPVLIEGGEREGGRERERERKRSRLITRSLFLRMTQRNVGSPSAKQRREQMLGKREINKHI